jgi:hypothetical protein
LKVYVEGPTKLLQDNQSTIAMMDRFPDGNGGVKSLTKVRKSDELDDRVELTFRIVHL